MDPKMNLFS